MDNTKKEVWVYIEHDRRTVKDVSLELLGKARELAHTLGVKVGAVLMGHHVLELTQTVFAYGADHIYLVDSTELKNYITRPYARTFVQLAQDYGPQIILIGATLQGRDLAPCISSGLSCGLTADCTELHISDIVYRKTDYKNLLLQVRPAFGGNIIATIISPHSLPQMASVREGVMKMQAPDTSRKGQIIVYPFESDEEDKQVSLIERVFFDKKVNLKKSDAIVAVGAGIGNEVNFKLAQKLAQVLGAQMGATRAAVERGFLSRDYQIGQTGITVRPKLYIACGISGAIQHRTGMSQSDMIITLNSDPKAPLISVSHHAIIGDLSQTLPAFIETIQRHQIRK